MENKCINCQESSPNHNCACSFINYCPCMNCLVKSMCSKFCVDFLGHSLDCRNMLGEDDFWGMDVPYDKLKGEDDYGKMWL